METKKDSKGDPASYTPYENFTKVDNKLLDYFIPLLDTTGIVLYELYARLQNKKDGYAFPTLNYVAKKMGMTRRWVRFKNSILKEYDLIQVSQRKGRSNKYFVKEPRITQKVINDLREIGIDLGTGDPTGVGTGDPTMGTGDPTPRKQRSHINRQTHRDKHEINQQQTEKNAAVGSENSQEEADNEAKLVEAYYEATKLKRTRQNEVREQITKLLEDHTVGYIEEKIGLLKLKMQKGKTAIRNPLGWLTRAVEDDYGAPAEIDHPYLVKNEKSASEIGVDVDRLTRRQVGYDTAVEIAQKYESDYIRRSLQQIERDCKSGVIVGYTGAVAVKRITGAYEPADYPDESDEVVAQ